MTIYVRHILRKVPLFFRVVSLHIMAGAVWILIASTAPEAQIVSAATVHVAPAPITTPTREKIITGQPSTLTLPRLELKRKIIIGTYDYKSKQWTLAEDKAQYAAMTPAPNTKTGQTLIYGHDTAAVFEPLGAIRRGDELRITTTNGHTFIYTYDHDRIVKPNDTRVLTEVSKKPRVVLMTCEGWLSETRRLLYFTYKEVR